MNRSKLFFMLALAACLNACKSGLEYTEHSFERPESSRQIPYLLSTSGTDSAKMLVLLNEYPDRFDLSSSDLPEYFAKENYHILIPGRVRGADIKEERVQDMSYLIKSLDSLHKKDLIILGIGEGAYLLPKVAFHTSPNKGIMVNASFHSMLYEFEQWLKADTISPAFEDIMEEKRIQDTAELKERINLLKEDVYGMPRLSPASNNYWMSYYNNPLVDDIGNNLSTMLWVNFKDYPLITPASRKLNRIAGMTFQNYTYKVVEGNGDFGNADQVDILLEEIKAFLEPKD